MSRELSTSSVSPPKPPVWLVEELNRFRVLFSLPWTGSDLVTAAVEILSVGPLERADLRRAIASCEAAHADLGKRIVLVSLKRAVEAARKRRGTAQRPGPNYGQSPEVPPLPKEEIAEPPDTKALFRQLRELRERERREEAEASAEEAADDA